MNNKYYQPTDLVTALEIKSQNSPLLVLAGGTDLVVEMRDSAKDISIMSLSKVKELKDISENGHLIKIGAMVTFTEIAESSIIAQYAKAMGIAAASVGSPQIRNRGTIGGSICNANPAADIIPVLVCLEAVVSLLSIEGTIAKHRQLPIEQFILGRHKTALNDNEILIGIEFAKMKPNAAISFEKIGRRKALAIARLNGACLVEKSAGKITKIIFSIGAATSAPYRSENLGDLFINKDLDAKSLKAAGEMVVSQITALTGVRKSSVYKYPVIDKLTAKLIQSAYNEAVE